MVRWLRIFNDQHLEFWILGLVLFALQAMPYMIMSAMKLEPNPIMNMQESSAFLDICEKVLGSLCIVIMTFIVQKDAELFSVGTGVNRIGLKWSSLFCY